MGQAEGGGGVQPPYLHLVFDCGQGVVPKMTLRQPWGAVRPEGYRGVERRGRHLPQLLRADAVVLVTFVRHFPVYCIFFITIISSHLSLPGGVYIIVHIFANVKKKPHVG